MVPTYKLLFFGSFTIVKKLGTTDCASTRVSNARKFNNIRIRDAFSFITYFCGAKEALCRSPSVTFQRNKNKLVELFDYNFEYLLQINDILRMHENIK